MEIEFDNETYAATRSAELFTMAKIKVIGVGGAGGNAVNCMIDAGLKGVEFVAVNTDWQALSINRAETKVKIGDSGLGAGGKPEAGRIAAEKAREKLLEVIDGSDMVFITAGMGGGTGTGAAPVIASIAREVGALTVGVFSKPFHFEGLPRQKSAISGIDTVRKHLDTMIVIPNQRLLNIAERNMPMIEAFRMADEPLLQATRGISEIINVPGLINVDFNDVRSIMQEMGDALMGTGIGRGDDPGCEAAEQAINSPLLENVSILGARGVLINITGGPNMGLYDIDRASNYIREAAGDEANIIFGVVVDPKCENEMRVTVIATGFNTEDETVEPVAPIIRDTEENIVIYEPANIARLITEATEEAQQAESGARVVSSGIVRPLGQDILRTPTFIRLQAD